MTESSWLQIGDVPGLLQHLGEGASQRKLRLFTCATAVAHGRPLMGPATLAAVRVSEAFADGGADEDDLARAAAAVREERDGIDLGPDQINWPYIWPSPEQRAQRDVNHAIRVALATFIRIDDLSRLVNWQFADAMRLRDLFGNPFCPAPFDRRWRTPDVVDVARGIYHDLAFDRLPILIDALMDAGCEDRDVLAHFRRVPPHARGCYFLDLLLGKE